MKTVTSNFRIVLLTLATVGTAIPQVALAHGGGGGGSSSSGASHAVSHASNGSTINTQFSSKSVKTLAATPSIPIPPPSGNKLGNFSTTAGSASTTSAVQKANLSGISGKSTVPTTVGSQDHVTANAVSAKAATAGAIDQSTNFNPNRTALNSNRVMANSVQPMHTMDLLGGLAGGLGNVVSGLESDLGPIVNGAIGLTEATCGAPITLTLVLTGSGLAPIPPDARFSAGNTIYHGAGSENALNKATQVSNRNVSPVDATAGYENAIVGQTFFTPGKVATQSKMDVHNTTGIPGTTISKGETMQPVSKVVASTGFNTGFAPPTSNSGTTKPGNMKPPMTSGGSVFGGGFDDSSVSNSSATTTDTTTTTDATPNASTTPSAAAAAKATTGADLVLEDVRLDAPATLVAGPAYTVKFRNQGTQAAGKFLIGVFAGLGDKLSDDAPRAIVEIDSLAAGEVRTVSVRLPQAALRMAGPEGKPAVFTKLFIGVDILNNVAEIDETNNTAVVDRAALETTAN
ncbi:MAG TPA: CARDB domain-containing protein [Pirellulales bacterium]|nr:CARDB domain-containing protein [Pirellulales bacterium]